MDQPVDLSPDIKKFAAENEQEIKAVAQKMLADFFDSTITENYLVKYDQGTAEHGLMTEEKLTNTDWIDHLMKEFQDTYWYIALTLFKQRRGQEER